MFERFKRTFGKPCPISDTLWSAVSRDSELLASLDMRERAEVRALARRFLQRCRVVGARDFEPAQALVVRVAGEACALLAGLPAGLDAYRSIRELVLYPGGFRVTQRWTDEHGIEHEREAELAGEAWEEGRVILARDDVERPAPGFNVVVHEFAHVLDAGNGAVNGFPAIEDAALRARWPDVFQAACSELQRLDDEGLSGPIDAYALENAGEFFAVASETFFTDPHALAQDWPEVYAAMSGYYGQEPLARFP